MAAELCGKQLGKWHLQSYINCGKSALVFRGEADGRTAAVKVFDPEIVEAYGDQRQLERIERERQLAGRSHPNLIEIYDGGVATFDGGEYFHVAMQYFPGKNLAESLSTIRPEDIGAIITQVAAAAEFLETLGMCHRDIKPENIGIAEDGHAVKLFDLGVLRPLNVSSLTDTSVLPFLGTLRYAPPEYLLREEDGTPDGWRALTFYQLGGVLHDLIMRAPLFQEFSHPYAASRAARHSRAARRDG